MHGTPRAGNPCFEKICRVMQIPAAPNGQPPAPRSAHSRTNEMSCHCVRNPCGRSSAHLTILCFWPGSDRPLQPSPLYRVQRTAGKRMCTWPSSPSRPSATTRYRTVVMKSGEARAAPARFLGPGCSAPHWLSRRPTCATHLLRAYAVPPSRQRSQNHLCVVSENRVLVV